MPLAGNLSTFTCQIFKLDPTATVPLEPLVDLVPGITPLRVTLDLIDSETQVFEYDTTEHQIQGFTDVTSHVRKRPETITVVGTLGALPPIVAALPAVPVPGSLLPLDKIRFANLKQMADERRPVMVTTPRANLAKAIMTSVQGLYTPANGASMTVSIVFRQIRLVSPLTLEQIQPDFPAQTPGNNAASGGGQSSTSTVDATATPSTTPGVAPTVGAAP